MSQRDIQALSNHGLLPWLSPAGLPVVDVQAPLAVTPTTSASAAAELLVEAMVDAYSFTQNVPRKESGYVVSALIKKAGGLGDV